MHDPPFAISKKRLLFLSLFSIQNQASIVSRRSNSSFSVEADATDAHSSEEPCQRLLQRKGFCSPNGNVNVHMDYVYFDFIIVFFSSTTLFILTLLMFI